MDQRTKEWLHLTSDLFMITGGSSLTIPAIGEIMEDEMISGFRGMKITTMGPDVTRYEEEEVMVTEVAIIGIVVQQGTTAMIETITKKTRLLHLEPGLKM